MAFMNLFHLTYIGLTAACSFFLALFFRHRVRSSDPDTQAEWEQRFAVFSAHEPRARKQRPRIWMHAVSVGEVGVAEAVIRALDAEGCGRTDILVTTTTVTGQRHARTLLGNRAWTRFAPLDLWAGVGRFLSFYQPDLLVCVETEIWPNWIARASMAGIPVIFVNGRISSRSIRSYRLLRPLLRPVLEKVTAFSMISKSDAQRMIALGAPAHAVQVNGNVKTDIRRTDLDTSRVADLRKLLDATDNTPVFVAGSVRGAEIEALLDQYGKLAADIPGLLFILAPRHLEKVPRIIAAAESRNIDWQRRTALGLKGGKRRRALLVILDTLGELRQVYGLASVVFCGGSLVPLGGQNVLEPAMWGKPVLYGPFMDDFAEAAHLLEASGGGIRVTDAADLADRAIHLLRCPEVAREKGRLARQAVLSVQGAAGRHARVIRKALGI